eukprot:315687_1
MSRCPYLFIFAGSIGLYGGYWQTTRRQQKIDYLAFMKKRINAEPIECPTTLTESELNERKMERVYVEGIPDFKNEIVVGPDKPPKSSGIHDIEYDWGGYVYTPITLKSGQTVLMKRGWIKEEYALDCAEPKQNIDSAYYKFYGLLVPLEFVPEEIEAFDVAKIFWPFIHRLSINTRWENINIPAEQVPVVVTVTDPKTDEDMPVRMKEKDFMAVKVMPMQHLSYVIFWYAMCGISWFYAYTFWRNPRARNLFKRRYARPVLRRSDINVLQQHERNFKL